MFQNLNGPTLLIILAVILLLFGAAKLPALAKSIGQSARVFKGEMKELKKDDEQPEDAAEGSADAVAAGTVQNAAADAASAQKNEPTETKQ